MVAMMAHTLLNANLTDLFPVTCDSHLLPPLLTTFSSYIYIILLILSSLLLLNPLCTHFPACRRRCGRLTIPPRRRPGAWHSFHRLPFFHFLLRSIFVSSFLILNSSGSSRYKHGRQTSLHPSPPSSSTSTITNGSSSQSRSSYRRLQHRTRALETKKPRNFESPMFPGPPRLPCRPSSTTACSLLFSQLQHSLGGDNGRFCCGSGRGEGMATTRQRSLAQDPLFAGDQVIWPHLLTVEGGRGAGVGWV